MIEVFPFQAEGARWLAQRERGGCLDQMGLGKTATAIRALDLRRISRGIVICPANLRANWIGEFHKFAQYDRRLCRGTTIHDFQAWRKGRFDVLITSYEMAVRWAPMLRHMGEIIDFLIIDEWHYLKNPDSLRSKAILGHDSDGHRGIAQIAEQAWVLTGTLMPNDPMDCFTLLRFTRGMPFGKTDFRQHYMVEAPGMNRTRPKPELIGELQALIGNNSIARTEQDVGLELPPIWLTSMLVDGDTAEIRKFLAEYPGLDRSITEAIAQGGLSFLDAQHVETLRRLLGEAKAVPYAEILYDELQTGLDKMVVIGVHRKGMQLIHEYLLRRNIWAVMVHGDTPVKAREQAVHVFQSDKRCRVFIGQMTVMGVGQTLHAAAAIDIFESAWSPGPNAQAIFRIRRIGQTRSMRARFITLARTFEEVVQRVVIDKTMSISRLEKTRMLAAPLDDQHAPMLG